MKNYQISLFRPYTSIRNFLARFSPLGACTLRVFTVQDQFHVNYGARTTYFYNDVGWDRVTKIIHLRRRVSWIYSHRCQIRCVNFLLLCEQRSCLPKNIQLRDNMEKFLSSSFSSRPFCSPIIETLPISSHTMENHLFCGNYLLSCGIASVQNFRAVFHISIQLSKVFVCLYPGKWFANEK